jgi:hypothetical protein
MDALADSDRPFVANLIQDAWDVINNLAGSVYSFQNSVNTLVSFYDADLEMILTYDELEIVMEALEYM